MKQKTSHLNYVQKYYIFSNLQYFFEKKNFFFINQLLSSKFYRQSRSFRLL